MSFSSFMDNLNSRRILGIILLMTGIFLSVLGFQTMVQLNIMDHPNWYEFLYFKLGVAGVLFFISGLLVIFKSKRSTRSNVLDEDHIEREIEDRL